MTLVYAFAPACIMPRMETALNSSPTRRSRMRRVPTGKRIELQRRDLEIFSLLKRYRYLRSTYIHAFVGGDRTKLIERLGKLYHEGGYLDRPAQQWESVNARHQPAVYEISRKGDEVLRAEGLLQSELHVHECNGEQRQFRHALMICDVLASAELCARTTDGIRFISGDEILHKCPQHARKSATPVQFPVAIAHEFAGGRREETMLNLIADGLFGLEYASASGKSYRFFALEADRGTMPAARETLRQSSFLRKALAYREVLQRQLYKARLGLPNLVVLTVTTNEPHMHSIMRVARDLCGENLSRALLFKTLPRPTEPLLGVLMTPWHRPGIGALNIGVP